MTEEKKDGVSSFVQADDQTGEEEDEDGEEEEALNFSWHPR